MRHVKNQLSFYLQDCYAPVDVDEEGEEGEEDPEDSTSSRYSVRPLRMWTQSECLLYITWEASRGSRGVAMPYLGVFDLNQWYSSQTPNTLSLSARSLSPFWAAIPFDKLGKRRETEI